jgi:hypothetical protein
MKKKKNDTKDVKQTDHPNRLKNPGILDRSLPVFLTNLAYWILYVTH